MKLCLDLDAGAIYLSIYELLNATVLESLHLIYVSENAGGDTVVEVCIGNIEHDPTNSK